MNDFILKTNSNQIINLGAGFDASFFRLKHQNRLDKTLFIEVSKSRSDFKQLLLHIILTFFLKRINLKILL